jgi:alkylation response protein AidB-like acyl-CoA dehydrogenase
MTVTATDHAIGEDQVQAACQAAADHRDHAERSGRLHPRVSDALLECGLDRACLPRAFDGLEMPPPRLLQIVTALSRADAAAGWTAAIHAPAGIFAALLTVPAADTLLDAEKSPGWIGGSSHPAGTADPVSGGYRLNGTWPLVTGAHQLHLAFLAAHIRHGDGRPQEVRWFCVHGKDLEAGEDWDAHGLCGTDSSSITVTDLIVPADHTIDLAAGTPTVDAPLFRFPRFGLLACCLAAVAVGTADHAHRLFVELASRHRPRNGSGSLAEQTAAQITAAQTAARLGAAHLYLSHTVETTWQAAQAGPVSEAARAELRLAAAEATRAASEITRALYEAAGSAAVFRSTGLERCMRDQAVISRHALLAAPGTQRAGHYLLTATCPKDL